MFKENIVLIGTVPPPAGGDAMWAKDFLTYNKEQGRDIPLVNTSLIGTRANTVDENRKLSDEIKRSFCIWKSIFKKVFRKSTDIVHMNINCSPLGTARDLVSSIIIEIKRVPFVVHCHCNIADQIGSNVVSLFLLKCVFRLSKKVIVLNDDSYKFASSIVKTKVVLVPNFITMDQFFKNKVINEELKHVVFIGHIRHTKGIDELLEAANNNPDLTFTLIGPITEDYTGDEILSRGAGNIILKGSVSPKEVNQYLDQADVFLLPSYTEGFSRALVEAMARGVPCIATDVGANKEMLEGEGGIIIQKKDVGQICTALNEIRSCELRRKMSQWNYKKSYNCYSIESVMNTLFAIYSEVTNI